MTEDNVVPLTRGGKNVPTTDPPRELPFNTDAEHALLGAILIQNRTYDRVVDLVRPEDFGNAVHARIFQAIGTLIDRNQIANPITLMDAFENDEALKGIGAAQYLARLAGAAITLINAEDFARVIADLAARRRIIGACMNAMDAAYKVDLDQSAADILTAMDQELLDGACSYGTANVVTMQEAARQAVALAEKVYQANGELIGITTGLKDLDKRLGGMHNGDLIVVAGRPSMGKSALAEHMVANAARDQAKHSYFVSLEMSASVLAARELAVYTSVPSQRQRSGPLTPEEMNALIAQQAEVGALTVTIDDGMARNVGQIRARARKLRRQGKLDLLVVDHIGLMLSDGRRNENRVQEISAITRGLKQLAVELSVPVIAVSQLNRAVETRDDKRPMLADLRDSGSIEQDADVVLFLYRDEYYLKQRQPKTHHFKTGEAYEAAMTHWNNSMIECRNVAEIIVGKNRHGAQGKPIKARFDDALTSFDDLWEDR